MLALEPTDQGARWGHCAEASACAVRDMWRRLISDHDPYTQGRRRRKRFYAWGHCCRMRTPTRIGPARRASLGSGCSSRATERSSEQMRSCITAATTTGRSLAALGPGRGSPRAPDRGPLLRCRSLSDTPLPSYQRRRPIAPGQSLRPRGRPGARVCGRRPPRPTRRPPGSRASSAACSFGRPGSAGTSPSRVGT